MRHEDELVISGAEIWDPSPSIADAVLVRDGRIALVGDRADVEAVAGNRAKILDAEGRALVPGFHDAHVHPLAGGMTLLSCDLSTHHDIESYRTRIADYVQAEPNRPWITGGGWYGDVFDGGLPTAAELDRLTGDRPTALTSHDAHGIWVNSAALRLAGIDRRTPDPNGGRVVRDAAGEPTGVLFDAAMPFVANLAPAPTVDDEIAGLRAGMDYLVALGVTSASDALVGSFAFIGDSLAAYEAIAGDKRPLRRSASIWWPIGAGADYLDEVLDRRARLHAAGVRCDSVKVMQDGICENLTAAMLRPYGGGVAGHEDHVGDSSFDPSALRDIVIAVDAAGLRVHFHGVGDRAVRECLDAVEAARRVNGAGPQHQIAHVDVVHPDDVGRFAELDVAANLQPLWARADTEILERKLPLLDDGQRAMHFPFASLAAAGAPLAIGSDWPVSRPDPMWALHAAVTRTAPRADVHACNPESQVPMNPDERLTLSEALAAYTTGSAAVIGRGHELGRIERGFIADLVLLDGPLGGDTELDRRRVDSVIFDGRLVDGD